MLVPASRVNYHARVPPMESDRAAKTAEDHPSIAEAKRVLRVESAAILGLIDHLDDSFIRAVELIHDSTGRVVTMGLG